MKEDKIYYSKKSMEEIANSCLNISIANDVNYYKNKFYNLKNKLIKFRN